MSLWDDLVGQGAVVEQLRAAALAAHDVVEGGGGRGMTHAWLFTGPPGSGRSTAARAFAAALQCTSGPTDLGCGHCPSCLQVLHGSHTDVAVVAPQGLSIKVEDAREIVDHGSRRPSLGRWLVTLIEDADRMTDEAVNAMLKAIEEPPPRGVLLLCAPSAEDLLPTIRSRCRLASLRTPPADAVAEVLVRRDGVDPAMAAFAARASQGHVGRARRLATDEQSRRERQDVLSMVRSLQTIGSALEAAAALVDAATDESKRLASSRDDAEKEELATALGAGATGKGLTGGTPRGGAGALKDLEKKQKSRTTRTLRDALDRALVDLTAFYRDVLTVQLGTGSALVHVDLGEQAAAIARATTPESTLHRLDAIGA
ncbi:MAG: polymerase delta prime subunit, partial [Frankiales bacterium]|nr:polymerase delta prime subunit [Frankiales bacterium]